MLKRKFIGKMGVGLLTSAALFSFILPTEEASATFSETLRRFMSKRLTATKSGQPQTLKSLTNRTLLSVQAMLNLTFHTASMRTQEIR